MVFYTSKVGSNIRGSKKMRQIIIGFFGAFAGAVVFADGLYLGGQFGGDMSVIHRDTSVKHTLLTAGIIAGEMVGSYHSPNTHKLNLTGGAYAGYSMDISDNKSIALEFDYFITQDEYKYRGNSHDTKILGAGGVVTLSDETTVFKDKKGGTYGVSVLGGYGFNEKVKVYGRIGIAQTSLKYERWGKKARVWKPLGMMLGMGVELNVSEKCENFRVRADYRYIHYPTKKLQSEADTMLVKSHFREANAMRNHMVMVGIHYQF